jgi:hypothetical protein
MKMTPSGGENGGVIVGGVCAASSSSASGKAGERGVSYLKAKYQYGGGENKAAAPAGETHNR